MRLAAAAVVCALASGCGATRTVTTGVKVTVARTDVELRFPAPAPLPRVAYAGARPRGLDPYDAFVPDDARPWAVLRLRPVAGTPVQLVVDWSRSLPRGGRQWAVDLWQLRRDAASWRLLRRYLTGAADGAIPPQRADVDGDGHD